MEIRQRTATLDDASLLLKWRNNAAVREFSRNSNQIENKEHYEWLKARLERVQFEPFLLFETDFKAIGMSRLDIATEGTNKFEISILVDPKYQGNGIGSKILKMTCMTHFGSSPNSTIISIIHNHNFASQKLFLNAGFEFVTAFGKFLHFEKKP